MGVLSAEFVVGADSSYANCMRAQWMYAPIGSDSLQEADYDHVANTSENVYYIEITVANFSSTFLIGEDLAPGNGINIINEDDVSYDVHSFNFLCFEAAESANAFVAVIKPASEDVHEHSYTYTSNNNGTHNGTCECGEDAIVNEACAYVNGMCDKCGYAEPVTPPAPPAVNVPISNNENKVDVEAEISGNDATVKPLDEEQINKLVGSENASGDVVIDLSKLDESIDTAGIPKATLESIVKAAEDAGNKTEYLVIKLSTAELKLDDTAMRAIVDQANGDVIKFNFDDVGLDRLNATQKDAIKDMDVRKGYEAYITVNNERIGDFKGGEVEIIVPYEVP